MEKQDYINGCEENLLHVYNRFPVVFDHGEGMRLFDTDGKSYLDFGSGIGVMAFGYGHPDYTRALHEQVDRLMHTSNLYYTPQLMRAAQAVCRASGMDKVFFTNSGAEAIEGAIKTAKKYAYKKTGKAGKNVIAFNHSFHGRTVGALSVTGNEHYREAFYPLMDGVRFADFNDIDSVRPLVDEDTCAIIVEPVQGEGGIIPAAKEFLLGLRQLCDENDMLLIFDEIQCGMGRTGHMYTFLGYDITPDVLTTAKALGGGVPVGAFAVSKKVGESSLQPGDHGTTYGGNPFVCAAVTASIELMESLDLPGHVRKTAPYLEEKLDELCKKHPDKVLGHRGLGFMQGLILSPDVKPGDVVVRALEKGLVVLTAGSDVLRLLPPLIAEKSDIDEMAEILDGVFMSF
ncbi:MAG: acetylornithine/succinylornithine family transaminase [Lachnospiraceae bacterium]|nr:acetylornithine/succinylornithine family transaminase [Lachnospiraceae bacterium]